MKYRRFEELPVWNDAIDLARDVFMLTAAGRLSGYAGLRDQIERAAVSVSNNIAEGFERGTNPELLTFLYIVRGSAGEVRSMLCLIERVEGEPTRGVSNLKSLSESISRQLGRWIESIKDSGFKGSRYQNNQTRQESQAALRRDAFLDELRKVQDLKSEESRLARNDPSPDE